MGRKKPSSRRRPKDDNGATLGFEAKLWQAADTLRGSIDAAEYKDVDLGLIFLRPQLGRHQVPMKQNRSDPDRICNATLDQECH